MWYCICEEGGEAMFDIEGFRDNPLKNKERKENTESVAESIQEEPDPLLVYKVLNRYFNLRSLLENQGISVSEGTMYCPFHEDELTGKPSAKYHSEDDTLFCFSEHKVYTAYHAIKLLYHQDTVRVFKKVWNRLPKSEKKEILSDMDEKAYPVKFNSNFEILKEKVLYRFRDGKVSFKQYKIGLLKTLIISQESEESEWKL